MSGLHCRGDYCEDKSIQCMLVNNTLKGNCYWAGWFSEESSFMMLAPRYHAAGLECSGDYCDNLNSYKCQAI